MRRTLPMLLSAVLAIAVFARAQTAGGPPARPYVAEHYRAALTLDFEHRRIDATETIRLRCSRGSISEVELDADEIVITSAQISREELRFSQSMDAVTGKGRLRVRLNRPLNPGSRINLQLIFHGSPTKGLLFFQDQAYTVYNTSHWLAVNHEPNDLATLTLSLNVPVTMVAIGNGDNIANRRIGSRVISEWDEKRAAPDFVFGFAVGPFVQESVSAGNTKLRYLGTRYSPIQMRQIFHSTPNALRLFSEKAGVAYPSRTYSQILASGNPEQELADFTLLPGDYGESLLGHPDDEWLLAHELAHQWWGIGVACESWSHFWLNEGVASFMADVFLGEQYGQARYEQEIESARSIYSELKASGRDHPLCYMGWKSEKDAGGRLPYVKGAWVLHLLKQRVGDEAFWRGFRIYTRKNWDKTATTRDFQSSMEQGYGSNLQIFFDEWVYR
jgi:aminopeptidase N